MESKKIILSYCKNFERIMGTDFLDGDNVSMKLVEIYKDFIFKIDVNNLEDVNKAILIDTLMGKYIEDYAFRKKLQGEMRTIKIKKNAKDMIRSIVDSLIDIFKKYQEEVTRKIYISRWI